MLSLLLIYAIISTLDGAWSDVWNHHKLIPEWCWERSRSEHSGLLHHEYVDAGDVSPTRKEVRFDDGTVARPIIRLNSNLKPQPTEEGPCAHEREKQTLLFDESAEENDNLSPPFHVECFIGPRQNPEGNECVDSNEPETPCLSTPKSVDISEDSVIDQPIEEPDSAAKFESTLMTVRSSPKPLLRNTRNEGDLIPSQQQEAFSGKLPSETTPRSKDPEQKGIDDESPLNPFAKMLEHASAEQSKTKRQIDPQSDKDLPIRAKGTEIMADDNLDDGCSFAQTNKGSESDLKDDNSLLTVHCGEIEIRKTDTGEEDELSASKMKGLTRPGVATNKGTNDKVPDNSSGQLIRRSQAKKAKAKKGEIPQNPLKIPENPLSGDIIPGGSAIPENDSKSLELPIFRPVSDPKIVAAIKKKLQSTRDGFTPLDLRQCSQVTVYWEEIFNDIADPLSYDKEIRNVLEQHRGNHFIAPFLNMDPFPARPGKKLSLDRCLTERNRVLIALYGFLDLKHVLAELVYLKDSCNHQANLEHVMFSLRDLPDQSDFEMIYKQFVSLEPSPTKRSSAQKEFHKYLQQQSRPKTASKKINFNLKNHRDRPLFHSLYRFFQVATESMVVLLMEEAKSILYTRISPRLQKLGINTSTVNEMIDVHTDFLSPYNVLFGTDHLYLVNLVKFVIQFDGNDINIWRKMCSPTIKMAKILEDINTYHTKLLTIDKLLEWRAGPRKRNLTIIRHGKDWGSPVMDELVRCIARDGNLDIVEQRRAPRGFLHTLQRTRIVSSWSWNFALIVISNFFFWLNLWMLYHKD